MAPQQVTHLVRASVAMLALALCCSPGKADETIGRASAVDGDTLEIHGTRIRLWGIDAPESSQLC
jgi:endonuclease YncB( thermonuclease family)